MPLFTFEVFDGEGPISRCVRNLPDRKAALRYAKLLKTEMAHRQGVEITVRNAEGAVAAQIRSASQRATHESRRSGG
ncbi:hypothetical protein Msil_1392 [Methylocella silvestris BL2]|uniref:Uncharacterized protein n=1 Tax=Methylocella silvestris (strain DSM 15510 / CIP 108128 / LMG 27833 / NCIMB 13906 / BL2) TaxID=395965 RepID=B8ESM2_METSB|nr:hypothetical protein Msil_1392 [Methylocella silvestris BL2]